MNYETWIAYAHRPDGMADVIDVRQEWEFDTNAVLYGAPPKYAHDDRPPVATSAALLLDAREAAALIRVSRATFWKLYSQGNVPAAVRFGARVVRWRKQELETWVAAGCPKREKRLIKETAYTTRGY